ncbi:MAG: hypothetical protein AAF656_06315 [Planctomycetota bacterium]
MSDHQRFLENMDLAHANTPGYQPYTHVGHALQRPTPASTPSVPTPRRSSSSSYGGEGGGGGGGASAPSDPYAGFTFLLLILPAIWCGVRVAADGVAWHGWLAGSVVLVAGQWLLTRTVVRCVVCFVLKWTIIAAVCVGLAWAVTKFAGVS